MKFWINCVGSLFCVGSIAAPLESPSLSASKGAADSSSNGVAPFRISSEWINDLAEEMRTNHPAIHALRWRANAAESGARAVRTWEDPMATLGGMGARTGMRADDGDVVYGVEQKLPLFGKPQSMRRLADAEAIVESSRVEAQFQTLRSDLAKALFRAGLADRAVRLGSNDVAWLGTLVETVDARYRNGTASLNEVLQAQNERARRLNALRNDESALHHEHITLNRLLGRQFDTHWQALELPSPAAPVAFTPQLMRLALNAEPKLRVMGEELNRNRAAIDSVHRQQFPEISLGAQGRTYSRNGDFRSAEVMLAFNLPWGNRSRYREEIKREKARVTASEYEIDNERRALREEIHQLTIMIENARREAVLYRDEILPRSRMALEAAHSAWLAGTAVLREVIDAQRMLTEAELMFARAVSEQYQAMSELVLCCGLADFEALQMIGVTEEKP